MNFQNIPNVETSKALLNTAFKKAREKADTKGFARSIARDKARLILNKEKIKLDVITDILTSRLTKILRDFPELEKLPPFYNKLMHLTIDIGAFKKSCAGMKWGIEKVLFFRKTYVSKMTKERNPYRLGELSKEFYGRISSVAKQLDPNFRILEAVRRILRTYPDIKEMYTVCLYGFPNVGKSTLLNQITGTKAEVASYAFTTKSINTGYFKVEDKKIQVLDVPGTLSREDKLNLIEMQAELVIDELASLIVFIFDLSWHSGYSIDLQEDLLKKIKHKHKEVYIYISKKDLTDEEVLKQFKHKHYSLEEIKSIIEKKAQAQTEE